MPSHLTAAEAIEIDDFYNVARATLENREPATLRAAALYDAAAGRWVVVASDPPGLNSEGGTLDELHGRIAAFAPEFLHEFGGRLAVEPRRWRVELTVGSRHEAG